MVGSVQTIHGPEQVHWEHHGGPVRGPSGPDPQDPREVQQVHGLDCRDDAALTSPRRQGEARD